MKEIKDVIDFSREIVQGFTDKIQDAVFPITKGDTPFLVFAMRRMTEALETEMDAEQKEIADILGSVLVSQKTVISGVNIARNMARGFDVGGDK